MSRGSSMSRGRGSVRRGRGNASRGRRGGGSETNREEDRETGKSSKILKYTEASL